MKECQEIKWGKDKIGNSQTKKYKWQKHVKLSSYQRKKNDAYKFCLAYLTEKGDKEHGMSLRKQVF